MAEPLLTVADVAAVLQVSRSTVYALIRAKKLRAVRVARKTRIHPRDFNLFINAHATDRRR
jgi:excisionase family DNA binding protein